VFPQQRPNHYSLTVRETLEEQLARKLEETLRAGYRPRRRRLGAAFGAAPDPNYLRAEPKVARMLLRRLVGPLTLWEDEPRPAWIRREAQANAEGLLDGLVHHVASPMIESPHPQMPSWSDLAADLDSMRKLEGLLRSAA
jgi:hypothetical protein